MSNTPKVFQIEATLTDLTDMIASAINGLYLLQQRNDDLHKHPISEQMIDGWIVTIVKGLNLHPGKNKFLENKKIYGMLTTLRAEYPECEKMLLKFEKETGK